MMQIIYHIDLNSFFASCELMLHPEYKGKPLVVSGHSKRAIVSTASYEARAFGIHSAMPIYQAKALCKDLIIVEHHFDLYRKMSKMFFEILNQYTSKIEIASIDEAYLDMTEAIKSGNDIIKVAKEIQQRVYDELHLPCSVGIAPNKFLAKMASDRRKPMGLTILTRSNLDKELWPLPIAEMHGIGKKTAPRLEEAGILTIGDLVKADNFNIIKSILGTHATSYIRRAQGYDHSKVDDAYHDSKSVGHSTTFEEDTSDYDLVEETLSTLVSQLCVRARRYHLIGNNISITLKYTREESIVRSISIEDYTNDENIIMSYVMNLLERYFDGRSIRLVGVSLNNTVNEKDHYQQLSLFNYQEQDQIDEDQMIEAYEKLIEGQV